VSVYCTEEQAYCKHVKQSIDKYSMRADQYGPGVTAVLTAADREGPAPTWVLAYSCTVYTVVGSSPLMVWFSAVGVTLNTTTLLSPFFTYDSVYPSQEHTTHVQLSQLQSFLYSVRPVSNTPSNDSSRMIQNN